MILLAYLCPYLYGEKDALESMSKIKKIAEKLLAEVKAEANAYMNALTEETNINKEEIFKIPIKYLENIIHYQ